MIAVYVCVTPIYLYLLTIFFVVYFISVIIFASIIDVTINVFLRADEIEMVMTDLERANQVRRLIQWHIVI